MRRNLKICFCIQCGEAFLYESPAYALSTFSKEIARESFRMVENDAKIDPDKYRNQTPTPILTLTEIFETYVHEQIHFCKIDVEGFEKEVLLGVKDWQEFRPWTFCIESTIPTTEIPTHEDWEYILLEAGYHFVTMYGVNRYYVDSRRIHLAKTHVEIISFLSQFDIRKMQMSPQVKFV